MAVRNAWTVRWPVNPIAEHRRIAAAASVRVPDGQPDDRFSVDDGDALAWDARDRPALEVDEHVDRELGCLHERLDERLLAEGFDRLDGGRERRRVVDAGRAATALAEPRLDERRVADAGRIVVDGRGGETGRSDCVDETALVATRVDRIGSRHQDARTGRLEARSRAGEDRQLFVAGRHDQADPIVIADPQQRVDERRIVRARYQPSRIGGVERRGERIDIGRDDPSGSGARQRVRERPDEEHLARGTGDQDVRPAGCDHAGLRATISALRPTPAAAQARPSARRVAGAMAISARRRRSWTAWPTTGSSR